MNSHQWASKAFLYSYVFQSKKSIVPLQFLPSQMREIWLAFIDWEERGEPVGIGATSPWGLRHLSQWDSREGTSLLSLRCHLSHLMAMTQRVMRHLSNMNQELKGGQPLGSCTQGKKANPPFLESSPNKLDGGTKCLLTLVWLNKTKRELNVSFSWLKTCSLKLACADFGWII